MPHFNAITATGLLIGISSRGLMQHFLGSCFAFRDPHAYLTAAHCVGELDPERLAVWVPGGGPVEYVREDEVQTWTGVSHPLKPVTQAVRHESADIAVLRVAEDTHPVEPFWGSAGNFALGEEFRAFGYPENVLGQTARMPTARLFTGHYQRFFQHQSHAGYSYLAGEMSIPAPAGLSGGPLFRAGAPSIVTALAAENFDSATTVEASEEVLEERGTVRTHYQRIISYGLAVMLEPLNQWFDTLLPKFDSTAYAERQREEVEQARLASE